MSKEFHRNPSRIKLSKLCIRCHRTDIIDSVKFAIYGIVSKYFDGDICKQCYPIMLKRYKLENPKLTKEDKELIERLSKQQSINN